MISDKEGLTFHSDRYSQHHELHYCGTSHSDQEAACCVTASQVANATMNRKSDNSLFGVGLALAVFVEVVPGDEEVLQQALPADPRLRPLLHAQAVLEHERLASVVSGGLQVEEGGAVG